jgi:hypothetical protein
MIPRDLGPHATEYLIDTGTSAIRWHRIGEPVDLSKHGASACLTGRPGKPVMVSLSVATAGHELPLDAAEELARGILRLVEQGRSLCREGTERPILNINEPE